MKLDRHICFVAAMLLVATWGRAQQQIVRFSVPSDMCAGSDAEVSFGFRDSHNVVLYVPQTTLGHSERIFLPDGIPCGNLGCSYQSPVTFTDFLPGATITSVQDIQYVRLNMEHSYIGDIYINITCPNGQSASLMNYSNGGSSQCTSTIPSAHRGWSAGNNVSGGTFLGDAYDFHNATHKCDSTATSNNPGIGWNYCWSENTTSGYTYAHASANDDGIIYRSGHAHYLSGPYSDKAIDSSNVQAGTNFYRPNQSFTNLIGCPLNGEWYIEVIDGYSQDNGYIFEWELALNAALVPQDECVIDSFSVSGYGITRIDDSTFTIAAPDSLTADTTVLYTYRIHSNCGIVDTTATITFHPNYLSETDTTVCEQFVWKGFTYTSNTNLTNNHTTAYGCDSIERTHVSILPGYHLQRTDTIVENDLPLTVLGRTFDAEVTDTLLTGTTDAGCDSNILYSLVVHPNRHTEVYDTICADLLPYSWNGLSLNAEGEDSVIFPTSHGADSVVILHLSVLPVSDSTLTLQLPENSLPASFAGHDYYTAIDTLYHTANHLGCDSTVHFSLSVYPNRSFSYSATVCDNQLPYDFLGHTFTDADSITLSLTDIHGADSIVTLTLAVLPTYHTTIDTAICDNMTFLLGGSVINESGIYTLNLTSTEGCDSVIDLNISILPHEEVTLRETICVNDSYLFGDQELSRSGTYVQTLTNRHGCDSILTLHLAVQAENLQAVIRAHPSVVGSGNLDFRLLDESIYEQSRLWIIGDAATSTDRVLNLTYDPSVDSLPIRLVAYSPEGCADTDAVTIFIDRAAIAIPNTFTPGESTNSTWQPSQRDIKELEVWIYNRNGLLVAHLEGLDACWDGTHDGTPCPQGAYVYNLHYRSIHRPNQMQSETGTILLIR